jgi:hypothetical protein
MRRRYTSRFDPRRSSENRYEFFRLKGLPGWQAWLRTFCFLFAVGLLLAQLHHFLPLQEGIHRVMARMLSPTLASWYPHGGRDLITVVQVDDEDLAFYKETWPLSYAFHARRLREIAGLNPPPTKDGTSRNEGTVRRPKAIIVDLLFLDERKMENLEALKDTFCRIRAANIPVYLASMAWTGQTYKRTDDVSWKGDQWCVSHVSVAREDDPYDYSAWMYPLSSGVEDLTMPTAALAVYRDLLHRKKMEAGQPGRSDAERETAGGKFDHGKIRDRWDNALEGAVPVRTASPLALIWGAASHRKNSPVPFEDEPEVVRCTEDSPSFWQPVLNVVLFWKAAAVLVSGHQIPICPYNRVLSSRDLLDGQHSGEYLNAALHDRVVVYGVSVQGAEDKVRSPLHGVLPGPHLHAMALDNMLSFKGRTKLYEKFEPFHYPWSRGTRFTVVALIALAAFMTTITKVRPRIDEALADRWIGFVYRYRAARDNLFSFGALRRRYFFAIHSYRAARFVCELLLYGGVALVITCIGYVWFELGPLTWIEYALFFILAHFLHLGPWLERWVSKVLLHRERIGKLETVAEFKKEAKETLTSDNSGHH